MKHVYNQHINAMYSSMKHLCERPIGSSVILIMLGIALTLPLTLYLSVQSFEFILSKFTIDPSMTVFMDGAASEQQISTIASNLQGNPVIKSVKYIDKEDALLNTANLLGQDDLVTMFENNPLPDAFIVTPISLEPKHIAQLVLELKQLPAVHQITFDFQWIQTLYQIKNFANKVCIFLSITLAFAFILISYNTIRLQILSCKDEIEISHLLGATSSFIRLPFLYQAVWQTILTIVLGVGLSCFVMLTAFKQLREILAPYGILLQQKLFTLPELFGLIFIMIFLAITGAAWATGQFMREFKRQAIT